MTIDILTTMRDRLNRFNIKFPPYSQTCMYVDARIWNTLYTAAFQKRLHMSCLQTLTTFKYVYVFKIINNISHMVIQNLLYCEKIAYSGNFYINTIIIIHFLLRNLQRSNHLTVSSTNNFFFVN